MAASTLLLMQHARYTLDDRNAIERSVIFHRENITRPAKGARQKLPFIP